MKFLCLDSEIIQIIIFIFNDMLRGPLSAHSKHSRSNISINSLFLLANSSRDGSYWLIPSLAHFFLAVATSWSTKMLLYAHSKCVGSCYMWFKIWQELLYLISRRIKQKTGLYDVNREAPTIFWIRTENPVSILKTKLIVLDDFGTWVVVFFQRQSKFSK